MNHFQHFISSKRIVDFIGLFSMFFMGAAIYVFREKICIRLCFFVLSLILLILAYFNQNMFFIIYIIVLPYFIFYVAYAPSGWIRKFNNMGDYSYGIYIYAFPVQQSIIALNPRISTQMMVLLSASITFPLAFLSWHIVEKHSLKMKGSYVVIEQQIKRIMLKSAFIRNGYLPGYLMDHNT